MHAALRAVFLVLAVAAAATTGSCRGGGQPAPGPAEVVTPEDISLTGYRALRLPDGGAPVAVVSPDAEIVVRVALPSRAGPAAGAPGAGRWVALASVPAEGGDARAVPLRVAPASGTAVLVRVRLGDVGGDRAPLPLGAGQLVALTGEGAPPFPERVGRWLREGDLPATVGRRAVPWEVTPPPSEDALRRAGAALERDADGCRLAEDAWESALAALSPEGRATAWERLGKAWWTCQDLPRMRSAFDRAAETAVAAHLPSLAAGALRVRASRELWAGDLQTALVTLDRAAAAAPPEDVVGAVRWRNTRAWVDDLLGQGEQSFRRMREGLALAERHGLDYEAAYFRMSLAALLSNLGQHVRAGALLEDARAYFAREWARTPEPTRPAGRAYGALLVNAAWNRLSAPPALRRPGDRATAEWDLVRARAIVGALGERVREANVVANLAYAAFQSGEHDRAARLLDEADALANSLGGMHHTFVADLRGRIALAQGRPAEALAAFARLATLEGGPQADDVAWRAALGRGRAHVLLGDLELARAAFAEAIRSVERLSRRTPLYQGRAEFLGSRDEPALAALGLYLDLDQPEAAVLLAERERARLLRAVEARVRPDRLPPSQRDAWREQMAAVHAARSAWEASSSEGSAASPAAVRARDERRRALLDALDGAQSFLERAVPESFSETGAAPADLDGMRALLGPDDGLLYLVVGADEIVSLLVRRDEAVAARRRPVRAERLARVARHLREAFDTDALWFGPLAAELGDLVFGPWEDELPTGRLVLLPHGPLHDLPLHLLPAGAQRIPVGATRVVSYAPSAGLLVAARARAAADGAQPAPPLVVGDPTGDLPHATAEAEAVADALPSAERLVGAAATREALLARLPGASLVYWAGHAELDEDQAWWSALRTAGGAPLTLVDVLGLPLSADLVVLSGCATGRQAVPAASEPLGLADAFHAAGARAVVATLRPVRDADSRRFMTRFLEELRAHHAPAEALARTQRAFADPESGDEPMPRSSWGAYRLVGM